MNNLLTTGQLAKFLGVSLSTIYRWLKSKKIEEPSRTYGNLRNNLVISFIRLLTVNRRFNKSNFIQKNTKTVLYSRVSSYGQKADLIRQTASLTEFAKSNKYKNLEIISDIGSGLNYNKRGFKQLMKLIVNQEIDTIIIQHKAPQGHFLASLQHRLSRFGLGIITAFSNEFGTTIKVVENEENKSKDILLMNDLMALLTSFTGSILKNNLVILPTALLTLDGRRSHQNQKVVA